MFKCFKKRAKIRPTMTTDDVLLNVEAVKRRDIRNRRYICFCNEVISKRTFKTLTKKGYSIEILTYADGTTGFKISW